MLLYLFFDSLLSTCPKKKLKLKNSPRLPTLPYLSILFVIRDTDYLIIWYSVSSRLCRCISTLYAIHEHDYLILKSAVHILNPIDDMTQFLSRVFFLLFPSEDSIRYVSFVTNQFETNFFRSF